MARKRNTQSEIVVSSGASPARVRRTSPRAKAVSAPAAEPATPRPADTASASLRTPSHDDIALLAYSYWEARGCQGGSPEEDWIRAEQELLSRMAASASA